MVKSRGIKGFGWVLSAWAGYRSGMAVFVCAAVWLSVVSGLAASSPADRGFTFAVIGDRTGGAVDGVFEQVLDEVTFLSPDLVVTVGDHIQGYTPDSAEVEQEWDYVVELLEGTGINYHLTSGNHDIWDDQSRRIWQQRFGNPDNSFEYKDNLFILLDVATEYSAAMLPQAKIEWLEGLLKNSDEYDNVFVFYHKPFWCEDFSFGRPNLLHEMFNEHGVTAVFTGHYHRYFYTEVDDIRYFGVSSSGGGLPWGGRVKGSFYSYLFARVADGAVDVRLLEPGFTRPVDVVTVSDLIRIAEIERESVKVSEMVVEGARLTGTERVTIRIANPSEVTLQDTAFWILRNGWSVEPARDYVEVPPHEIGTITAFIAHDGPLYPAPMFRVHLPADGGEMLEVTEPLRIRRVISSTWTDTPPEIDGLINESLWGEAEEATEFFGFRDPDADAHFNRTVVRIRHDSTNLYFGIKCVDSSINEVFAGIEDRDGFIRYDDNVSFLVEPVPDSQIFYQVSVNSMGTLADQKIEICPFGTWVLHPEWDPPTEVAAQTIGDRWQVELSIPLSAFGASFSEGAVWRFNFQRWHTRLRTASQFQSPFRFDSDTMGHLRFE
jgi:hypothetical protein